MTNVGNEFKRWKCDYLLRLKVAHDFCHYCMDGKVCARA